jgi:hypothetical protein
MATRTGSSDAGAGQVFGVYTLEHGSYTIGDARFTPQAVVPTAKETADKACEETSPVKFFSTPEAASEYVGKLKAAQDRKNKPREQ